eukprot:TRINITY_DN17189_c0_g2_i10.p1 TRINITY_DN17189_c0_g2~~TRINITY_DN17189_c0_g2_i10.p1  ORF type:complete len:659 (-),score=91.87 TRINITY_DN17189_c0_g2_i10:1494-3242(-)
MDLVFDKYFNNQGGVGVGVGQSLGLGMVRQVNGAGATIQMGVGGNVNYANGLPGSFVPVPNVNQPIMGVDVAGFQSTSKEQQNQQYDMTLEEAVCENTPKSVTGGVNKNTNNPTTEELTGTSQDANNSASIHYYQELQDTEQLQLHQQQLQRARRTPKQQQQNKQAQQRYRQRKKQKLQDMEGTIDLLTQRIKQLQNMEQLNQQLLVQQVEAQRLLKSKDDEITWLRNQMSRKNHQNDHVLPVQNGQMLQNGALTQRIKQLQNMEQLNQQLLVQQVEAQRLLKSKDDEITWLRNQMSRKNHQNDHVLPVQNGQMLQNGALTKTSLQQDVEPWQFVDGRGVPFLEVNCTLYELFFKSVFIIREFFQGNNILQLHEVGQPIPASQVQKCEKMVQQVCNTCARVLADDSFSIVEYVHNKGLMSPNQDVNPALLSKIKPSSQQKAAILQIGKHQVQVRRQVYAQRQKINREIQQVIKSYDTFSSSTDVPSLADVDLGLFDSSAIDNMLNAYEHGGYFQNCGCQLKVLKLSKELRNNVQYEHKCIMQTNRAVVQQVLSPVQSAIYIISIFPSHCDVMPLVSCLMTQP